MNSTVTVQVPSEEIKEKSVIYKGIEEDIDKPSGKYQSAMNEAS